MKQLIFICIYLSTYTCLSQHTFQRTIGGAESVFCEAIQPTSDGGYLIAGYETDADPDALLIKTNSLGVIEWSKTYGGSDVDRVVYLREANDGNFLMVGHTASFGQGNSEAMILKIDPTGNVLWSKLYGGSGTDNANYIDNTTEGGLIVAGVENGNYPYLLELDSSGNEVWSRRYAVGPNGGSIFCVHPTSNGGFICIGTLWTSNRLDDTYVMQTDSTGGILWGRKYGGFMNETARHIEQTSDGGHILVGYTDGFGAGDFDVYVVKLSAFGAVEWSKTYGTSFEDRGSQIKQTPDGGYIVSGYTSIDSLFNVDLFLLKLDSTGDSLWAQTYGGPSTEGGLISTPVQLVDDGGYILGGKTPGSGLESDIYLIKTDSLGNSGCNQQSWTYQITNVSILVDPVGGVYTGATLSTASIVINDHPLPDSVLCMTIGVNEQVRKAGEIVLYPNPTTGKFRVTSVEFGVEKVEVYDLLGRLVHQVSGIEHQVSSIEIDLSSYPAGIYFVKIGPATLKLILR